MLLRIRLDHCTVWAEVDYFIIKGCPDNNISDDIEIKKITINNIAFDSCTFIPRKWLENDWGKWLSNKIEDIITDWDNPFMNILLRRE